MKSHNRQISNYSWRLFTTMIGALSAGVFALVVCTQMVQKVLAAPVADVTGVDGVKHWRTTDAGSNTAPTAAVPRAAATSLGTGARVSIVNFVFAPAEITIGPGETVTWTNDDGAPHGLKFFDDAKGTDLLLPGATFGRRFDRPGTYDYNCAVHPYMTGRVVVRAQ